MSTITKRQGLELNLTRWMGDEDDDPGSRTRGYQDGKSDEAP